MKKNIKVIIATVLVTVIVFVSLMEIQKSNTRANAIANLKSIYPQLKSSQEKTAATIETNTIINQNKSWFSFSNSDAGRNNSRRGDSPDLDFIWGWYSVNGGGGGGVGTSWGYYDPSTGEFVQGQ